MSVEPAAAGVLQGNPHLNEIDRRAGGTRAVGGLRPTWRSAGSCWRRGFDIAIDLHGGPRSAWLTWASRAPIRIGYAIKGRQGCTRPSWTGRRTWPRGTPSRTSGTCSSHLDIGACDPVHDSLEMTRRPGRGSARRKPPGSGGRGPLARARRHPRQRGQRVPALAGDGVRGSGRQPGAKGRESARGGHRRPLRAGRGPRRVRRRSYAAGLEPPGDCSISGTSTRPSFAPSWTVPRCTLEATAGRCTWPPRPGRRLWPCSAPRWRNGRGRGATRAVSAKSSSCRCRAGLATSERASPEISGV